MTNKNSAELGDIALALMKIHRDFEELNKILGAIQDILDDGLNTQDAYGNRGSAAVAQAIYHLAERMK